MENHLEAKKKSNREWQKNFINQIWQDIKNGMLTQAWEVGINPIKMYFDSRYDEFHEHLIKNN